LSDAKGRQNKAVDSEESETWPELFSALDAAEAGDDFAVERDVRPADERPVLDAFFAARKGAEK
jgi:hypothetical protein